MMKLPKTIGTNGSRAGQGPKRIIKEANSGPVDLQLLHLFTDRF